MKVHEKIEEVLRNNRDFDVNLVRGHPFKDFIINGVGELFENLICEDSVSVIPSLDQIFRDYKCKLSSPPI